MQVKPFQLVPGKQTQVLELTSRVCPVPQVGIKAHDPLKTTNPGLQPHPLSWLFHTKPLLHVTQEVPFQLAPWGQTHRRLFEFHICPEGQVTQVNLFQKLLEGQMQLKLWASQTCPLVQVMQTKPFQLAPAPQAHDLLLSNQTCPFLQVMQLLPFQFCPGGQTHLWLPWSHICSDEHRLMHWLPFQMNPGSQTIQVFPLKKELGGQVATQVPLKLMEKPGHWPQGPPIRKK